MTPEGRVKTRLKAALDQAFGAVHWRFMPVQTGFGGVAHDFIICYDGLFFSIETKKDAKSEMTALQKATATHIKLAGGIVLLVFDDDTIRMAVERIRFESENYGRYGRKATAQLQAQKEGLCEQHLREQQQTQTPDGAAGGDHGASGKAPKRRAEPNPREHHQGPSGGVDLYRDGHGFRNVWSK
jgi:hypothetical protein